MLDEFDPIFNFLKQQNPQVYLVGGAVRDFLLGQPIHDLDFVTLGDAPRLARQTANRFKGAYYLMDAERGIARVLLSTPQRKDLVLDFSNARGDLLESDLSGRDFTINAIAMDVGTRQIIDPLQGSLHLREKALIACRPDSFDQDPIRVLRAFRFSLLLNLRISPETKQSLFQAVPRLVQCSGERQRDELYRLLILGKTASVIRLLDHAGILRRIIPEYENLLQAYPGGKPVGLELAIRMAEKTDLLLDFIEGKRDQLAETLFSSLIFLHLGRLRLSLLERQQSRLNADHLLRGLVLLAAIHFPFMQLENNQLPHIRSALLERIKRMAFSRSESQFFSQILTHAGAFFTLLENAPLEPFRQTDGQSTAETYLSRREIYRYFKSCGAEGIEICLLSIAWFGVQSAPSLDQEQYTRLVKVAAELLSAYFDRHSEIIDPPPLLNGDDLKNHLSLKAGQKIGTILERIKEEQAAGSLTTRQQAFDLAKSLSR